MRNGKEYNMQVARRLAAVMILRQQALLRMFAYQRQYLQVLSLYLVLYNASNPLNTRSHALRGNAAPSMQKPGWPGGRSASEGESHNVTERDNNHIKPGGCLATDGEKQNETVKDINKSLYAFEYLTTESEIRVAPTTPLVGEPVKPRNYENHKESGHGHGRAHGHGHENSDTISYSPHASRSHALRGNAAPSTQKPGWPGGRSASEGERHNLILRVINPDQPGGCSASESVEQREKEERPCVKEGTLRMPPVVDRIASELYLLKPSANDLATRYAGGSQTSEGEWQNVTERGKNHVLYAFAFLTTESEIRVPPTTPLVGEHVSLENYGIRETSGHGHSHGQGHENSDTISYSPHASRSHALRGNAAPSTQKPGWPGGRSASEGERHNLTLRVINPDQPGGRSASESVEQIEKEERPCVKEGTLRMPPVVDRIASERYSMKTSANDLGTHYLVGSQASEGEWQNVTERVTSQSLYAFAFRTTESEIRVAPTTPLVGEHVKPRNYENHKESGHGRAHGQDHEKADTIRYADCVELDEDTNKVITIYQVVKPTKYVDMPKREFEAQNDIMGSLTYEGQPIIITPWSNIYKGV